MLLILQRLVLFWILCFGVECYSRGPPNSACISFAPSTYRHRGQPQEEKSPFEIIVSKATYLPRETLTVTIKSETSTFKGFLIKAKKHESSDRHPVGTFATDNSGTKLYCKNEGQYALGHSTARHERSELVLKWTAPDISAGDIVFQAAIVNKLSTYWVDVMSNVIGEHGKEVPTTLADVTTEAGITTNAEITTKSLAETTTKAEISTVLRKAEDKGITIDLTGCGVSKGCYRNPPMCTGSRCQAVATWVKAKNEYRDDVIIELMAFQKDWVALGFSHDKYMGGDYVIACLNTGDNLRMGNYYTNGSNLFPFNYFQYGLTKTEVSYTDGFLKCRTHRSIGMTKGHVFNDTHRYYNIDTSYNLLLGYGPVSGGVITKHEDTPLGSQYKIIVTMDNIDVGFYPWKAMSAGAEAMESLFTVVASLAMILLMF